MMIFPFHIKAREGQARTGVLETPRGDIRTPAFMPVGTAATVKGLLTSQVRETGADILLTNTYHLMLRPGSERLQRFGGVHDFMCWDGPILSDSGGYQVFSLSKLRKLEEQGVTFRSHLDGSKHVLTPERAMMIQADHLGVDIAMQLDECTPYPCAYEAAARSMDLSLRWAKRSRTAFGVRQKQTLFGIVQGSIYPDLRQASAEQLVETGFGGYAIGGLAVGEGHTTMCEVLGQTVPNLPSGRPRYLMGVGKPLDIVEAVARGIDMFDCVLPTRSGRHGQAWADEGPVNLKNARFAEDKTPLNASSSCSASRDYSKAYLHHLVKSGEILGAILLSWHNIAYFQDLMARIRIAVVENRFEAFRQDFTVHDGAP